MIDLVPQVRIIGKVSSYRPGYLILETKDDICDLRLIVGGAVLPNILGHFSTYAGYFRKLIDYHEDKKENRVYLQVLDNAWDMRLKTKVCHAAEMVERLGNYAEYFKELAEHPELEEALA